MHKKLALAAGSLVVLGSLLVPSLASASSLTNSQINAIISLLQAFGADSTTIANVQTALGGGGSVTHSCQDFAGLKYGDFDTAPGGSVSQLQSWLGVASNSFGYGTYGPKTLVAWRARCGTTRSLSASPMSGAAPLEVVFTGYVACSDVAGLRMDFGDGVNGGNFLASVCSTGIRQTHVYQDPGTYTARLYAPIQHCGNTGQLCAETTLSSATVTVTASKTAISATIDSSTLTSTSNNPRLTGTAHGTSQIYLAIYDSSGRVAGYNGHVSATMDAYGNWGRNFSYLAPGTYTVKVYDEVSGVTLMSATLTILSSPSASIDSSSLRQNTNSISLQGNASGLTQFVVELNGPQNAGGWVTVQNGRWQWPYSGAIGLQNGTYSITLRKDQAKGEVLATGTLIVDSSLAACPSDATAKRGQNGSVYACWCPAYVSQRTIKGGTGYAASNYYTDDSDICTAGAQAGQINLTSGGEIDYTVYPGQTAYWGFTQNGITSQPFGSWPGSFAITGPKG